MQKQLRGFTNNDKLSFYLAIEKQLNKYNSNLNIKLSLGSNKIIKLNLSSIQRQSLLNYLSQKNDQKIVELIHKLISLQGQVKGDKLLGGGGACCKGEHHELELLQEEQKNIFQKQKTLKEMKKEFQASSSGSSDINSGFLKMYQKYIANTKSRSQVVEDIEQTTEICNIIKNCLEKYQDTIVFNIDIYRLYVFDIFECILQYMVSQAREENDPSINTNLLNEKIDQFQDFVEKKCNIFECQDLIFMAEFLQILIKYKISTDEENLKQMEIISKFVNIIIEQGESTGISLNENVTLNKSMTKLEEIKIESKQKTNLINQVKNTIFNQEENNEVVWKAVDNVNEKLRDFDKDKVFKYLACLWAMKIDQFGKQENVKLEDELQFYIERFVQLSKSQTSNYLILYLMATINNLLEKIGLRDSQNKNTMRVAQTLATKVSFSQPIVQEFIHILQQKSNQKSFSERFFFQFSVKDPTYRFLANQILLKLKVIQNYSDDVNKAEKDKYWMHLCYQYVTEKNESVKITFLNNQDFVDSVNSHIAVNQQETSQMIIDMQKDRKEQFLKNGINEQEFSALEDQIKGEQDFIEKISLNLIKKWELEARKRLDKDTTLKDDVLLEVQDLYISQNFTYLQGNESFKPMIQEEQKELIQKNAIQQIIDNFLKPNYENQKSLGSDQQISLAGKCKILGILAEGGTGKSMLIKKLETLIIKEKNQISNQSEALKHFIPFLIKCNNLDAKNPSLDDYFLSQNLDNTSIQTIKKSSIHKLILLDGYDEYSGEYFQVYSKLKLLEWNNAIVIVTSRKEKLSEADACSYFSIDDDLGRRDLLSFSLVKLEEFKRKDVDEYCVKYFRKQRTDQISKILDEKQFDKDIKIIQDCLNNKILENLLFLPINLYLFTRMIATKDDTELKDLISNISDQIQIQEMFFYEQFSRESKDFTQLIHTKDSLDIKKFQHLISSAYFEYFQSVAMQMFLNKGKKANFLQIDKSSIDFKLQNNLKNLLEQNEQAQLMDKIRNYVNSKIITREKNEQVHLEVQNLIEFRHKSLFEYFVARSMKFDFEIYGESIYKEDLQTLSQFSINKKSIMNLGQNQSEQQILIKLYKLIKKDIESEQFLKTYHLEKIDNNNRYIQYIKRSQISKNTEVSVIDTGASNLLSAIFMNSISFSNLNLSKCSLSKSYIPYKKDVNINIENCNFSNAYLEGSNLNFDTSNTSSAFFQQTKLIYSSDQTFDVSDIQWVDNKIYSVNNVGYLNCVELSQNKYKHISKKKITPSPLQLIQIQNKMILVSSDFTLFLMKDAGFELIRTYTFKEQIKSISFSKNNNILISLSSQEVYHGDVNFNFSKLQAGGNYCTVSSDYKLMVSLKNNELTIYEPNQNFKQKMLLKAEKLNMCQFSEDSKFLAVMSKRSKCYIYRVENDLQILKEVVNEQSQMYQMAFSKNNELFAIVNQEFITVYNIKNNFEQIKTIEVDYQVNTISFSQNGQYLAVGTTKKQILIFDRDQEFLCINQIQSHIHTIAEHTLSCDQQLMATGSFDKTCIIWNAKTFEILKVIKDHKDSVLHVCFSSDSKYLVTSSTDDTCKIWNIPQGFELIKTITQAEHKYLSNLTFSSNGKYFVTSHDENSQIWDVEKGFQLIKEEILMQSLAAFSQNCKFLVSNSKLDSKDQLLVWDVNQGFKKIQELDSKNSYARDIRFSENNKFLAAGFIDCHFRIWNVEKGFELVKEVNAHKQFLICISFSKNDKYFATCSYDQSVKVWDIEKGFELINSIEGNENYISSISFFENDNQLITCSSSTFKIWNLENGFETILNNEKHHSSINTSSFSSDGKFLATGSNDWSIIIWRADQNFQFFKKIIGFSNIIESVGFSQDCKYFAAGSLDRTCRLYDVQQDFKLIKTFTDFEEYGHILFSKNGKYLVTHEFGGYKIWDMENAFELISQNYNGQYTIRYFSFYNNEKNVLAFNNEDCKIWSIEKEFKMIKQITLPFKNIYSHQFYQNEKFLITGSEDNTFYIWNFEEDFKLINTIKVDLPSIRSMAISQDEKYLITGHANKTCKIWNIERGLELVVSIQSHTEKLNHIALSSNSRYLATSSYDKSCLIYNLDLNKNSQNHNNNSQISNKIIEHLYSL